MQAEIQLLPQLIATLNNYACSLSALAKSTGLLFQSAFCRPCEYTTGEIVPKEASNLALET